jgi:hypothetical protein
MRGAISPLPLHVFVVWCLVKHKDNFTFLWNKLVKVNSFWDSGLGLPGCDAVEWYGGVIKFRKTLLPPSSLGPETSSLWKNLKSRFTFSGSSFRRCEMELDVKRNFLELDWLRAIFVGIIDCCRNWIMAFEVHWVSDPFYVRSSSMLDSRKDIPSEFKSRRECCGRIPTFRRTFLHWRWRQQVFFETLISCHIITLLYNTEVRNLHSYHRDNLKSYVSAEMCELFCLDSKVTYRSCQSASFSMGTGGSFPEGKAAGAWSWPLTSI